MFRAEFKTAYLQREIPFNAVVVDDLVVGEMVKVFPAVGDVPAVIAKLAAETEVAALSEATHFMAQSDMTMGVGHVPVEYRDYRYSNEIASNVDMTKVVLAGVTYHGVFAKTADLPSSASVVSSNDTAFVIDYTNGKLDKYVATVATSTVTWAKATSTAAYSVDLKTAFKNVATFKITNKDDIIVYDED